MNEWYSTFPVFKEKARLWDRQLLDKGVQSLGSLAHFKRFYDKLHAGQPITAVAFGSSMVHDFAGCWQTSLQALWNLGIIPNPVLYPQQGSHVSLDRWQYVGDKCAKGGYMDGVMEAINATWPNFGHIFVNNGKGGTCLYTMVQASCMSSFTPPQVDLVLLDTVTNPCGHYDLGIEKMLRAFLHHRSRPLVVLVSNARNCNSPQDSNKCATECLRRVRGNASAPECQGVTEPYNEFDRAYWGRDHINKSVNPIASHYNVAHLDLFALMDALMSGGLPQRLGMERISLLAQFYVDWVHFNKAALGTLLLSDVLLHWLVRGQEALVALPPERQAGVLHNAPPAEPLHPDALQQYDTRCYGMSLKGVRDALLASASGAAAGADAASSLVRELDELIPGDQFAFAESGGGRPAITMHSLPPLNVTRAVGWELQLYYKGARGDRKLKPGWIASTAGAVLDFVVDSLFEGHAAPVVEALVSYTVSYDGWGVGKLCCTEGCACACQRLVAHKGGGEKTSLVQVHPFPVTQSRACAMRLEVEADSPSGGHKFKLSSVMLRAAKLDADAKSQPTGPAP